MPTTIKKIAQLSGVSITTVSKILNGKDHDLSQATIARVKAIIEQENYYPSILAQSMRNSQMKLIALMIPDVRNPFFTDVIRGCEDCANKYGYSLVFCNSDNILEKEVNYIRSLQSRHIDGIVLSGLQIESKIKNHQLKLNVPYCFVTGNKKNYINESKLSLNNEGSYVATQHLIDLGHKEILFATGPSVYNHSNNGLLGYQEALKEKGLTFHTKNRFFLSGFSAEAGYEELLPVLKETKASAIVCGNDLIAYGVLKALRELNKSVPEDFSVIGYDDIDTNQYLTPGLTSVNPNRYALGWDATIELIEKIENRNIDDYTENSFVKLIIRETCGEPKHANKN